MKILTVAFMLLFNNRLCSSASLDGVLSNVAIKCYINSAYISIEVASHNIEKGICIFSKCLTTIRLPSALISAWPSISTQVFISVSGNSDGIFICPFRMSMSSASEVECISPPTLAMESGTVESSCFMIESISSGRPAVTALSSCWINFLSAFTDFISCWLADTVVLYKSPKAFEKCFLMESWNRTLPSINLFWTFDTRCCFPLSSAVRRSLYTSLGAISFVANEASGISVVAPSSSANAGSSNAAWTLNTSYCSAVG